ncbi:MAG: phosphoribosylformylglycinamidine synthase subunit PurS [Acetobacter sp.]|nr:phosphoribosylformylglycinamidine synthase subunit PurS [Acetobacter sp.]MBO6036429.1 phosphoribosylformylglycinamidine synthase subunit PurS [Acetobacter sp.]MBO6043899.1 phosphoribosylformylglycinamidine synthase subunit PurS [Acetobacter sp.]MBO6086201.1 phosphoribosylformylglycinamidine synthase subunit PurS [Acetobacter sp.]MBO6091762.1 phosphoribosylformylglycinamidine synthase subunit PurS [Acetobacter sp.]
MKIRVTVMLKEGVLDPQGKAIGHALQSLGFEKVHNVRVGKVVEFEMPHAEGIQREKAIQQAETMTRELLANMVIEDFSIEVVS